MLFCDAIDTPHPRIFVKASTFDREIREHLRAEENFARLRYEVELLRVWGHSPHLKHYIQLPVTLSGWNKTSGLHRMTEGGLNRDLNPGPPAPKAGIYTIY